MVRKSIQIQILTQYVSDGRFFKTLLHEALITLQIFCFETLDRSAYQTAKVT